MWARLEDMLVEFVGKGIGVLVERRDLPPVRHRHELNDLDSKCEQCKDIVNIWGRD
jgi:hypothetical protein